MAFRHDAVHGGVGDGLLERQALHLGFAPRPALPVHLGIGQRDDDGHFFLAHLTLAIDAAQELVVLGPGPREDVEDQPVADVLQTIHARPDGGGGNENVQVALNEGVLARFIFSRVKADLPSVLHERVAQQPVDALDVIGVDERPPLDVLADHRQAGPREDLFEPEGSAVSAQSADLNEKLPQSTGIRSSRRHSPASSCNRASSGCRA